MTTKETFNLNYILEKISNDPEICAAVDTLCNSATELGQILAKRITNYIIQDTISNTEIAPRTTIQATQHASKAKKFLDLSKTTPQNLRAAYHYRKKKNLPIHADLNEALAATFPGYDKVTQTFNGHRKRKTTTVSQPIAVTQAIQSKNTQKNIILPLYSKLTNSGKYCLVFDNGKETKNLLTAAVEPYEVCMIDTKTKTAIIRKKTKKQNHPLFLVDYSTGTIHPEFMLGFERADYDTQTHDIYVKKDRKKSRHFLHISANSQYVRHVLNSPKTAQQLSNNGTIIIDENGHESTHPLLILGPISKQELQNKIIKQIIPKTKDVTTTQAPVTEQKTSTTPDEKTRYPANTLIVQVHTVKATLNGPYNNIYVNGKKILSNHIGTEIKLMFNDTLLAIHGIVTDNPNLPQIPTWQIYDTNLRSRISNGKQKFSGYNIHSKQISEIPDGLRIELSNRSTAIIKAERIIKEAGQKKFIYLPEHTK